MNFGYEKRTPDEIGVSFEYQTYTNSLIWCIIKFYVRW